MVESGYNIAQIREVPVVRMAEIEEVPEEFDTIGVRNVDEERLETEEMKVKVWSIPPPRRADGHSWTSDSRGVLLRH